MDWTMLFGFMFCMIMGMIIGMRAERARRDAEVDAYVIPEEDMGDAEYWRLRYRELAEEWEAHGRGETAQQ